MPEIRGDLSVMSLADLMIWLANREKTGVLSVESGGVKKVVTIEAGAVVRVSSTNPRESFGQVMVSFGLITEDQLERAFETQQETRVLLGRILVMIGLCQEAQVVQMLQYNIRETMLDAVRWPAGSFLFQEVQRSEVRPEIEVAVPLLEIHREAARRASLWEAFRKVFPSQRLLITVHEGRVPETAGPHTVDGRIIALARLGLSIEAIAVELHATDFHVHARLYDLYRQGVVEPRSTPGDSGDIVFPDVTPPNAQRDAALARKAYENRDFSRSLEHVQRAFSAAPGDPGLSDLAKKAEAALTAEMQAELPEKDAIPQLLQPMEALARRRMSARERYILTRIDGAKSIRTIMQVSPMREVEALQIFRKFVREGLIRV